MPGRSPIRVAISTALPRCRSASSSAAHRLGEQPEHPVDGPVAPDGPGDDDRPGPRTGAAPRRRAGRARRRRSARSPRPAGSSRRTSWRPSGSPRSRRRRSAPAPALASSTSPDASGERDHPAAPGGDPRELLGELANGRAAAPRPAPAGCGSGSSGCRRTARRSAARLARPPASPRRPSARLRRGRRRAAPASRAERWSCQMCSGMRSSSASLA